MNTYMYMSGGGLIYKYEKTQCIQRMILFIVKLFTKVSLIILNLHQDI